MGPENLFQNELLQAAYIIKSGGLVIFPTDTVYGVGACLFNRKACRRVFEAKHRDQRKPLVILLDDEKKVDLLAQNIPREVRGLMRQFWPGALTIILKKSSIVNDIVSGYKQTVGLRIPDNPLALELIRLSGGAIVTSSANLSGEPVISSLDSHSDIKNSVDMLINGGLCSNEPSTVIDASGGEVVLLRPGKVVVTKHFTKLR